MGRVLDTSMGCLPRSTTTAAAAAAVTATETFEIVLFFAHKTHEWIHNRNETKRNRGREMESQSLVYNELRMGLGVASDIAIFCDLTACRAV